MKLRVIIVDDERIARARLRRLLSHDPEVEVLAECADGASAVAATAEHNPDLLLLDVHMPGMDGFGVVGALRSAAPLVVFVTAFDQHAVRAFDTSAVDYLLKPVAPDRLARALARVRERLAAQPPAGARFTAAATTAVPRFAVRSGCEMRFIACDEIDWIESDGNYAILHVAGRRWLLRETMAALETRLPPSFLRVSRFAFVNLPKVRRLESPAGGARVAVMPGEAKVSLTRGVREIEARLRALPGA